MKNLINIKYWLFDLDNTLYSGQTKVFSEVDKKMSSFISKKLNVDLVKAREIQKEYFYEYGTTLSGLMNHDKIDPHEFLEFVHDIDISWLPKDELLREELIDQEVISGGMIPKINNCLNVASNGVKGVVIIDGRKNHSILFELLSDKGSGTLIRE